MGSLLAVFIAINNFVRFQPGNRWESSRDLLRTLDIRGMAKLSLDHAGKRREPIGKGAGQGLHLPELRV
jgi:hypothetical protein